jgi:hypothetical protein
MPIQSLSRALRVAPAMGRNANIASSLRRRFPRCSIRTPAGHRKRNGCLPSIKSEAFFSLSVIPHVPGPGPREPRG